MACHPHGKLRSNLQASSLMSHSWLPTPDLTGGKECRCPGSLKVSACRVAFANALSKDIYRPSVLNSVVCAIAHSDKQGCGRFANALSKDICRPSVLNSVICAIAHSGKQGCGRAVAGLWRAVAGCSEGYG